MRTWEIEEIHSGLIKCDFFISKSYFEKIIVDQVCIPDNSRNVEIELSLHDINGFQDDSACTIMMYVWWDDEDEDQNEEKVYYSRRLYELETEPERIKHSRNKQLDKILN
jgi:hypothetical protein